MGTGWTLRNKPCRKCGGVAPAVTACQCTGEPPAGTTPTTTVSLDTALDADLAPQRDDTQAVSLGVDPDLWHAAINVGVFPRDIQQAQRPDLFCQSIVHGIAPHLAGALDQGPQETIIYWHEALNAGATVTETIESADSYPEDRAWPAGYIAGRTAGFDHETMMALGRKDLTISTYLSVIKYDGVEPGNAEDLAGPGIDLAKYRQATSDFGWSHQMALNAARSRTT